MGRFEGRRLSWLRLTVVVAIVVATGFFGTSTWRQHQDSVAASSADSWFAGYVDATVTPLQPFEQPANTAARDVVLSFIVADPTRGCRPTWGGAYSLNAASDDLDLDRRIARLRQRGGSVAISFGGAINSELATTCTDPDDLLAAYRAVVKRYDLRTIDLDIEGAALADTKANARRATAIKALQAERKAAGEKLRVWLTLPVAPTGLTDDGKRVVAAMLDAQVDLTGVNVMTMDYGGSRAKDQSMIDASIQALESTHKQLGQLYSRADQRLGSAALWSRIGATPMIGQNDVAGEIFTIAAARELNTFAKDKGMGRMSMWSINRDRTCGDNYPDVTIVSNSCSGVDQGDETFAQVLRGDAKDKPETPDPKPGKDGDRQAPQQQTDDPANSPYPIWDENETYVEGTRIVWHRNAYVAKWWTLGDVPDDPVADETTSPWHLIGPVLPGEKPVKPLTLPKGTYPEWEPRAVYRKGERVMLGDTAFTAKWYSTGVSPEARATQAQPSPWRQLSDAELRQAIQAAEDD